MDTYKDQAGSLVSPIREAQVVTPNNTVPLATLTRAVYVGGAGSLSVIFAGGQTVTFANLPAGNILPIRVTHVLTSSTATGILALW